MARGGTTSDVDGTGTKITTSGVPCTKQHAPTITDRGEEGGGGEHARRREERQVAPHHPPQRRGEDVEEQKRRGRAGGDSATEMASATNDRALERTVAADLGDATEASPSASADEQANEEKPECTVAGTSPATAGQEARG